MNKNIKKLVLNNFQQWKNGVITFSKGLNVIMGDTESGKSTLFRAISSIFSGKMTEDYIRKGTDKCEVCLEFDSGSVFKRIRSKKENIAQVNDTKYERVGKEIPFDYFNKLGNTYINFGDKKTSLCLYSQFDPHFFITLSDYDKSKLIGMICGIDIVDKLIDFINKDIRQSNSNIKFLKENIDNDKKLLDEAKNKLEYSNKKLNLLSKYKQDVLDNYKTLNTLSKLKLESFSIKSDINIYENKFNKNKSVIDSAHNLNKVDILTKLFDIYNDLKKIQYLYFLLHSKLSKANNIVNFNSNLHKVKIMNDAFECYKELNSINDEISNNEKKLKDVEFNISNLVKQNSELLNSFDKCPLCGSIINEK